MRQNGNLCPNFENSRKWPILAIGGLIFLCEYIYDGIMFCFMKRTCLSFTIRPLPLSKRCRNVLRYQQVYLNRQSLETEGSNSAFFEVTKEHSVNLVQTFVKLDRLRRLYFFYGRNCSKASLSGDSVTLPELAVYAVKCQRRPELPIVFFSAGKWEFSFCLKTMKT